MSAMTAIAERSLTDFAELTMGLRWKPGDTIAMIQAFFDESGEHDRRTGRLVRLTIGGLLATVEAWQRFDAECVVDRFLPIIGKYVQNGLSFTAEVNAQQADRRESKRSSQRWRSSDSKSIGSWPNATRRRNVAGSWS
jgi:hypothetical protein